MISPLMIPYVLEEKWMRSNPHSLFLPFWVLHPHFLTGSKKVLNLFMCLRSPPNPPPLNHSLGDNEVNEMNDSAGRVNCEWCIMGALWEYVRVGQNVDELMNCQVCQQR